MCLDRKGREAADLGIRDRALGLELVGECAEAGSEDDRDLRRDRGARLDDADRIRDANLEILDAQRLIAAQGLAKFLLADVERCQRERGIGHVLGPNRTVPNRITVAPSATAVA